MEVWGYVGGSRQDVNALCSNTVESPSSHFLKPGKMSNPDCEVPRQGGDTFMLVKMFSILVFFSSRPVCSNYLFPTVQNR